MKNLMFLLLPILALISCDSTKKTAAENTPEVMPAKQESPMGVPSAITVKRGPCMGKCPVYTLTINERGAAEMTGRKYAVREGDYSKTLSKTQISSFNSMLKSIDFQNMKDRYDSGILDAPTTTLIVKYPTGEKTISLRAVLPDALKPLLEMTDNVYKSEGWTAAAPPMDNTKAWTFATGPCLGKCPVVNLQINSDGTAMMQGKRYAAKQGKYEKGVTRAQLDELTRLFDSAKWWDMKNRYDSGIADAPQTTVSYRAGDMIKEVSFRAETPEGVQPIFDFFQNFVQSEGWVPVRGNNYGLPKGTIASEIILRLKEGADIDALVGEYVKQEMKLVKTVAAGQNMHLVSYNPELSSPQEMMTWLSAREDVQLADFNREVNIRED